MAGQKFCGEKTLAGDINACKCFLLYRDKKRKAKGKNRWLR
jgi:hypothetical protein